MRVSIIGLGVIGGSLGMAIAQNNPLAVVTGHDVPDVLRRARRRGAIHRSAAVLADAVKDADFVFLCTPISSIVSSLPRIAKLVKSGAVVTDVGSVKSSITAAAARCFKPGRIFVGGHPMAGSEGSGIDHADPLLFQNAVYALCPGRNVPRSYARLVTLIQSIGARVLIMDAREHDRTASIISHLPQILAVGMMTMALKENRTNSSVLELAAGGFRDITRIASSPFPIWKDILSGNAAEIKRSLKEFRALLSEFETDLSGATLARTGRRFSTAKQFRDAIPRSSKGFLHPLHDIFVWVDDRPGVLSIITTALYRAALNIKDIELLKIREGRGGTFRVSFDTAEMAARARKALRAKKFRVE
jgi:prephenate dehydrogenase